MELPPNGPSAALGNQVIERKYPWHVSTLKEGHPFCSILTRGDIKYSVAEKDGIFGNKLGNFQCNDVLGTHFGQQWVSTIHKSKLRRRAPNKVKRQKSSQDKEEKDVEGLVSLSAADLKGHAKIHYLPCTPELWCRSLRHRTQIIYSVDASLVCFHLDLLPGKVVAESGTGSGSLSHYMARAVAPNGKVNTFEFNEDRVGAAKADFELLGIEDIVTVRHGDAYSEGGFDACAGQCDAVFLDVPNPWRALKNCVKALKPDVETRLCSFSPCIEQVQRTCLALQESGFFQIRTFECIVREFESYRLQERVPKLWEDTTNSNQLKETFNPAIRSGSTTVFPEMATHTGYLTFCTRFPLLETNPNGTSSTV